MDELELIEHCKRGDLRSFNCLVQMYQTQVYNVALRFVGNAQAAEDATQEAFISAFKGIRSFRGGSFRAWLLRITANASRDLLRSMKRRPTLSLDSPSIDPGNITSNTESVEGQVLRREVGEVIGRGLAQLPADQRLAVILCDIQGLSYEEMAQAMGCSLGTVKSRLSRGRAQLRDYLVQQGTFPTTKPS
ncbi:MAG: sigma-70 family RNA polymerase sigma factor [Chloroflexi bacterium]|nr:sigma-70 family RNA polymerase sigma factor [Chloroflexota bacterium]